MQPTPGQQRQRQEAEERMKEIVHHAAEPVQINGSFVAEIRNEVHHEQAQKLRDMEEKLKDLEAKQKSNLTNRFLAQTSVRSATLNDPGVVHRDPAAILSPSDSTSPHGANKLASSLIHAAQIAGARNIRLPNQQIFRQKLVLLGHQEVGKTSLRKCFESDPIFFMKKLPEVKSTTGIETQSKVLKVGDDQVELIIADFAGQEAYHSHTLFLTGRSIFALVWKISAIEQDFQSSGISEHEEKRLQRWIAEVYSKFPTAKIVIIATHLDELRDQSQKGVEMILNKVERMMTRYKDSIARTDPQSGKKVVNEIIGSFAVSCKQRTFIAAGKYRGLSGGKMSALLQVIADAAHDACMKDEDFRCGAVPGRHIRLMQEISEMKAQHPQKLLLPLSEYVHMAVRCGVESDEELLQISLLLHSWNALFLFNQHNISENVFIFLHPMWLCRLAGTLFSYAHVLQTPLHLRSIIGGLEYSVTQAEQADCLMMKKGFLRLPLAKVLFRKALLDFLKKEPEESDFDMCLQLLSALGLVDSVAVPCDDVAVLLDETPGTPRRGTKTITERVNRYFVPSLSPFVIPNELRKLCPLIMQRGVKVKFEFNMLPNEMWWRLQSRLQGTQQIIAVRVPKQNNEGDDDDDDDDDETRLPEADDYHNRWRDAMWLRNSQSRILLLREGPRTIRFLSAEVDDECSSSSEKGEGADELLKVIEEHISELLAEYKGIERSILVACPVPTCQGWHDVNSIAPDVDVTCKICNQTFPPEAAVVSGEGPLGPHLFPAALHKECSQVLSYAMEETVCKHVCQFLGVHFHHTKIVLDDDDEGEGSDEAMDLSRVDFLASLDKMIRGVILREATST